MASCEIISASDFDNTVGDTDEALRKHSEEVYPGQYKKCHFEPIIPGSSLPPGFEVIRTEFLYNPVYINRIRPYVLTGMGLELINRNVDDNLLISARVEEQKDPLREYLKHWELITFFSAMILRSEAEKVKADGEKSKIAVKENARAVKFDNLIDAGVTVMVEDDGILAVRCAEVGLKVALVDRLWNWWVPDGKNIIRFDELIDFGVAFELFNSLDALFAYNFNVRLGGRSSIQPPWRVTSEQFARALLAPQGKRRQPEEAVSKFLADQAYRQRAIYDGNYRLHS